MVTIHDVYNHILKKNIDYLIELSIKDVILEKCPNDNNKPKCHKGSSQIKEYGDFDISLTNVFTDNIGIYRYKRCDCRDYDWNCICGYLTNHIYMLVNFNKKINLETFIIIYNYLKDLPQHSKKIDIDIIYPIIIVNKQYDILEYLNAQYPITYRFVESSIWIDHSKQEIFKNLEESGIMNSIFNNEQLDSLISEINRRNKFVIDKEKWKVVNDFLEISNPTYYQIKQFGHQLSEVNPISRSNYITFINNLYKNEVLKGVDYDKYIKDIKNININQYK